VVQLIQILEEEAHALTRFLVEVVSVHLEDRGAYRGVPELVVIILEIREILELDLSHFVGRLILSG